MFISRSHFVKSRAAVVKLQARTRMHRTRWPERSRELFKLSQAHALQSAENERLERRLECEKGTNRRLREKNSELETRVGAYSLHFFNIYHCSCSSDCI
jgi:uncharacterized protein HemY